MVVFQNPTVYQMIDHKKWKNGKMDKMDKMEVSSWKHASMIYHASEFTSNSEHDFQNANVKNKHTISHNQIHIFVRFAKFVVE